jgi:hypothetical protein
LFNGVISTFSKQLCCILVMKVNEVGKIVKGTYAASRDFGIPSKTLRRRILQNNNKKPLG